MASVRAEVTENQEGSTKISRAIIPQVVISCTCFVAGTSYGMSAGHSAVLLPHLQSDNSSLVIDENTGSWIASVYAIASPVGCLLGGLAMDLWGRRNVNMFGNIGMVIGWLLITFADSVAMLISGRIIEGFSRSILATCITVFVDELADPKFRGFIVCSMFTCVSVGIMAISCLGAFVNWRTASALAALPSIINLVSLYFVSESPTWFVRKNRVQEAESALKWLWGPGNEVQAKEELHDLISRLRPREQHSRRIAKTVRNFFKPSILKPFFIIHLFNVLQTFCGLGILTYYTVDILSKTRKSGTEILDDYSTTVLLSAVRVLAVLISSFLMLKAGRRTISIISGVLSSASALCLGIILSLNNMEYGSPMSPKLEANITLLSVIIYAGSMSFGFFALPSIMIGETQPSHVRGFACGYIYTMNDLLLGSVVKMYPWMSNNLQIHGIFLFFGISCVVCTIFVYLFLPETQGLTLQQIEDYFRQPNVMWVTRDKYANDEKGQKIDMHVNRIRHRNTKTLVI